MAACLYLDGKSAVDFVRGRRASFGTILHLHLVPTIPGWTALWLGLIKVQAHTDSPT